MKNKRFFSSLFFLLTFFICSIKAQVPQQEILNRGGVALSTTNGIFISWRYLSTDTKEASFDLYRDGVKINNNPISTVTNYLDPSGNTTSKYVIRTLAGSEVTESTAEITVWENPYLRIPLQRPEEGITPPYTVTNDKKVESYPDGQSYTYTPNDCSVGDVDGDGEYEIIVKWDPSNARDNSHGGFTGNVYLDCYKLDGTYLWRIDLGKNIRAGAHYTQFMVYDLDGDGKAEVVCKTAPGTIDGLGKKVIMGTDDPDADYRNSSGYILSGPEYLTVFNGETGGEITTVAYNPLREKVDDWGDSYGNRVDRFLACIAYLDGIRPSIVMCRGYYTRAVLVAYDFDGTELKQRWIHDSAKSGQGAYGEGAHSLAVGDVDNDGFDEIVYGASVIDHDGSLLYRTGFGHGDALHLSDLDPDIDGLEIFMPHESKSAPYGYEMHMGATGEVIFGEKTGTDVGRGISADIDPDHRGSESWSTANSNVYNCKGEIISGSNRPSVNFRIYWDGDLQDELLDGTVISKWDGTRANTMIDLSTYHKASSCNSTKKTPNLSADILGDWREEVILWDSNTSSHLLVFTTTIPSEYRIPTLMHDHIYRMSVAWQNVAYNQPPHLGYYLADADTESARFIRNGEGSLNQSIEIGKSIQSISYKWVNAADVEITGLPEGIIFNKNADEMSFTISGTPTQTGEFDYSIKTVGGLTEASLKGTIRVKERTVLIPVAHFAFDESTGSFAENQISGRAEAVGFTPEWVEGIKGNALQLPADPADRRMVQTHYPEFTFGSEDFSFEVCFRSEGGSSVDWYLVHTGSHAKNADTGATGKWIGLQYKNEKLTFGIDDDVNKSNIDISAANYFNNEWTHVVCVRDIDNKELKMYINGKLAGKTTDKTGDISQTEDLVIGNCNVNFNTPFHGALDELKFYKGAMTEEMVIERYQELLTTSVGEDKEGAFVQVYPVLFKDQLTLKFDCDSSQDVNINLYSVSGMNVYNRDYKIDGQENITLSGLEYLPDGMYTLVIETPTAKMVRKVVK